VGARRVTDSHYRAAVDVGRLQFGLGEKPDAAAIRRPKGKGRIVRPGKWQVGAGSGLPQPQMSTRTHGNKPAIRRNCRGRSLVTGQ